MSGASEPKNDPGGSFKLFTCKINENLHTKLNPIKTSVRRLAKLNIKARYRYLSVEQQYQFFF